ncbi:MAG: ATP-binding protein, partial [Dehalococcoidia bacterium]|nr:ATP-binding protein [Dehalococcoidia bacterium]
ESIFQARVERRLPYQALLILEEALNFVPAYSASAAEAAAIATTKTIAQEGRKFGVGLVLISQRPSRLDETVLSQCNSFIIMRLVNPADQSFVRKVVESLGSDDTRLLPDLDVGEALLSGQMVNFPVLARIAKPKSVGEREEEDAFRDLENARNAQTRARAANSQQLAF